MEELQITLKPINDIDIDSYFIINLEDENQRKISLRSVFTKQRLGNNQIELGNTVEQTMDNLFRSVTLDYSNLFVVEKSSTKSVILKSKLPLKFVDFVSFNPIKGTPILDSEVIYFPVESFIIESVEYLPANTAQCAKCLVRVEFNKVVDSYNNGTGGSEWFPLNSDFVEFEAFRGTNILFKAKRNLFTRNENLEIPASIQSFSNSVFINVINAPNGSTAQAIVPDNNLQLEYSLNNEDWQEENYFSGLLEGNYTIYIRDYLGCSISKTFEAQPNVNTPANRVSEYHLISKANSIRYAQRVNFNLHHKTDENTLSCETDVILPYKQIQLFNSTDRITTQFQSNYENNEAFVILNDEEIQIPVIKKTNNMGLKELRTAIKYNLGNGKTGIYFITGDILDYDTGVIIDQYELNGFLPEWAIEGNYISVDGGWFVIEEIIFDDLKNADVIVINNIYNDIETNTIVGCEYNRENFEVYEFSILMSQFLNENFRVKIKLHSGTPGLRYQEILYLSEEISVKLHHSNTVEIRYRNTKNTDILYSTNIEHVLRIPIEIVSGSDITSSENHKTDTTTVLLDADIYEANKFKFEPLTKELWRKLMIALSHDTVFIDSVGYVKESDFETDGPLAQTNLYSLTANMIKTGNMYDRNQLRRIRLDETVGLQDVIGLIHYNGQGFISR